MGRTLAPAACFVLVLLLSCLPGLAAESGDVLTATLDNGLRVVIVRDPLAPVVTTEMNYLAGSIDEPQGQPGLAHAQEHMMFRDSTGLSGDQLAVISSAMGGKINGDTQETVTQYVFTVPAEDLGVALHIEALRMRGALDSDEQWAAERGAIEQEVAADRSSALYRARAEALAKAFDGTPYAHDALGTASSFESINGLSLQVFYSLWYAPNNAILVISGDVDPPKALATVQELFGSIPKSSLPRRGDFRLSPLSASTISESSDLPFSMAFIAYRLPGVEDKDYAAGRILAEALGNARAGFAQLENGSALKASFIYEPLPKASLGVAFAAVAPDVDLKTMARTLQNLVDGYVRDGVPNDLIEVAKRRQMLEAKAARASIPGLAQVWSQALAVEGRASPDEDAAALVAVTAADVDRVAAQYLTRTSAVVVTLQRAKEAMPMLGQEGGGWESFSRNPSARVALPDWAQNVLSSVAPGRSTVNPSDQRLANGMRLIVQREPLGSVVYVVGQVKTNESLEAPPGREGVSYFLDELLGYGTTTLDQLAFAKALDDATATFQAGTKFSMNLPAASFDQGMALLADSLQHPALPERVFRRLHAELVSVYGPYQQSARVTGQEVLTKHLYPAGDPLQRVPTIHSITSISLSDIRDYYHRAFRPDETTIVVVGDIAPEQARASVDRWFASWHAVGPKPNLDAPPVPPNKGYRGLYLSDSLQDMVLAEETIGLSRSSSDYYPFEVGNQIFGRASFAGRLFQDLRVQSGLVYTVDGEPVFNGSRAIYRLQYACDPANLAPTEGIVRRDLVQMQTSLVGQQELREAKAMLERQIPLEEASAEDIAAALTQRAVDGVALDEPSQAAQRYLQVTPEQIRAVFARVLSADRMVELVRAPR